MFVDKRVSKFIRGLTEEAVTNTPELSRALKRFVKKDLGMNPARDDRRFYPTNAVKMCLYFSMS